MSEKKIVRKKIVRKKRLPHWVLRLKSNNVRERLTVLTVLMNMPSNQNKDALFIGGHFG